MVGAPFFIACAILALETVILSIPSISDTWHDFRWWSIGSIIPYHFFGAFLLFLFVGLMIMTALKRSNRVNTLLFIGAMGMGGLMFLWSGIVDSTTGDPATRKINSWLHDSVWFPLMALFVLVFYLHLEFQTSPYPPPQEGRVRDCLNFSCICCRLGKPFLR